jgi:hypothetical protein
MLLRTLIAIAFVAALAEAAVLGAASLAKATLHHRAAAATRAVLAALISSAQAAAASAQNGSAAAPQPIATCAYADADGCKLYGSGTATLATPAPGATPAACPQTSCTVYLQANSAVDEGRIAFHLSASVAVPGGAALATRAGDVAFRTFSVAPFAALVGSLDATLDALENGGAGDDGGSAAANAATLIDVQYMPQGGGSAVSGNAWQAQDQHPAEQSPPWDR